MKLCPMRFMGYTWLHNPKSIELVSAKKIVKLEHPYDNDVLQNFGEKNVTIKGVGELFGSDCLKQYENLHDVYVKGEKGVLCLPDLMPIYACFEKLEVVANNLPDVLTYSFVFCGTQLNNDFGVLKKEVVLNEGQTLWDISYEYGVSIEKLCDLNDFMFVNDSYEGKTVKLC